jgi:GNAT superfamily N-acetyltransferase
MRAKDFITEAFDKPYAFNWSRGDYGDYDILVKLPDGSPLNIAFVHEGDNVWHVAFDRGHSQEITGAGDAQRIFATVLASIQQFIGKQNPDKLYFSASKEVEPGQNSESRANLYSRMVKRYASAWGYDSVVDDFGRDNVTYVLNKKQPVTEDSNNGKPLWYINSYDNFETAFEIDLVVDGKDIGFFSYQYDPEQDTVENDVRIINDSERGHGYGKLLLLKAIETAQQHNLPYKRDHRGTSPAQNRVYSSLVDDGIIKIGYDKTITLTGKNLSTTKKKQPKFSLIAHGEYVGHFDDYEDAVREADRIANDPNSKYQMVMVKDNSSKEIVYEVWRGKDLNEEEFNGINITMDVEGDEIMVTATGNGRELGHVLFVDEGEYLMPQDLEVDERFQGQGIAAAMYDYVKSKGYKIRRSGQQTDAGAGFWGKHRPEQNVWENESSKPTMGINVRSDGDIDYAGLIIDGRKKYESRQTDSLRPYVGKTVAIVRTGKGSAVAIGQVTVGEPVVVDAEKFDKMRDQHLVPQGSKFDIDPGATKYLYPMIDPIRWDREKLVKQKGIVARKIDDLDENFADGKVKGKSRPGRVKRAGASCNGSVTDLRARAKKASGELAKMYHWCANMKSGKKK